ncbi:sushi, von Willebrand factor type A, EGF and pentraxin domain-containing protein 1-like [Ostrea edulis]|uniref:sushi, von Willebrand factor type A, EGF and pentraxin domain-containing protein 1-like n=1 Tax=Ostrea edulis TaxID=37623 RepID=UPI0024AF9DBD|nr:sushi, von Willebrand factor type A, EGF and pentraxin domain-containing protein 1-like [Ostrea edulis]
MMERLGKVMCIFAIIHVRSVQCQNGGVNGNWGPWSQCSQTCGFGLRFRQRLCDNPSPKNIDNKCVSAMEEDRCNIETCSTTPSPNTSSPTTPLTSTTTPIPIICGEPPRIEGATISAGGNVEGTTRTYLCNQNTSTEGNTTITCGPDGRWSSTDLYCRPICGEPPKIERATISAAENVEGATRTYFCNKNTSTEGNTTITCGPDGQWSSTNLYCRLSCGPPSTIPRATISKGDNLQGTTRTYSCLQNTVMTGTPTITCGVDGQWSKTDLHCRRKKDDSSRPSSSSSSESSSEEDGP